MKEEYLATRSIMRRHYNSYIGEISPVAPNLISWDFRLEKPNEKRLANMIEFRLPARKYMSHGSLTVLIARR